MSLIRRGLLPLLAIAAAVAAASTGSPVGGTPAAAAEPSPSASATATPPPWLLLCIGNLNPPGFELEYYWYNSCDRCRVAGEAGLADGRWREYRCVGAPVGLDYTYPLYVRR